MYRSREFPNSQHQERYNESGFNRGNRRDNNDSRRFNSGPPRRNNYRTEENNDGSTIIHIANNNVGRVIGRGGSKIRELEEKSGARIKIDTANAELRTPVIIYGSKESQKEACGLIYDLDASFSF